MKKTPNTEIEYRIGDIVLIRASINSISQSEGTSPAYGVKLASGSTTSISQQHIAGITTDVPKSEEEEEG